MSILRRKPLKDIDLLKEKSNQQTLARSTKQTQTFYFSRKDWRKTATPRPGIRPVNSPPSYLVRVLVEVVGQEAEESDVVAFVRSDVIG